MQFGTNLLGLTFKPVDIVFIALFVGLLIIILMYYVFNRIKNKKTINAIQEEFECLKAQENNDARTAQEETTAEETEAVEEVQEETAAEEPEAVEEVQEETAAEEPEVVEEVQEETATEEPEVVEEVQEETAAEEPEVVEEVQEETATEEPEVVEEVQEETAAEEPEAVEEVQEEAIAEDKKELEDLNDDLDTKAETDKVEDDVIVEKSKRQYNGKYEVYAENEYYRYRLKASNGEILFVSEYYTSRLGALKSIGAVQRNLEKGKIEIFSDKRKNYKFQLKAANHRVLAVSANYSTLQGATNASESFKRFATTEDIVDVVLPAEETSDSALVEIPKVKEEDKRGGKFVLRKDPHGVFSWELKASNGEILCQADGYSSKSSLETSINSFKSSVKNGTFCIYADKNDCYQFKLYSQSGRASMIGESYTTSQQAQSVVTSILNFLDLAVVVDKTVAPVKKPTKDGEATPKRTAPKKTTKSSTKK